jgi:hypothetical protein
MRNRASKQALRHSPHVPMCLDLESIFFEVRLCGALSCLSRALRCVAWRLFSLPWDACGVDEMEELASKAGQ